MNVRAKAGSRHWSAAGAALIDDLADKVRDRAKDVADGVGVDPVHDMRTATRRIRTSIEVYATEASKSARKQVEDELRKVARRLGEVRDMDVLLEALGEAARQGKDGVDANHVAPLREAWQDERDDGAERLLAELRRKRFDKALDDARRLVNPDSSGVSSNSDGAGDRILSARVANRAPALVWTAYGDVLAYELDPRTADPAAIHETRIAAKKLRYTLEAFEDALAAERMIEQVTALQDAGGTMHDAIVAAQKARSLIDTDHLAPRERDAIEAFAKTQDERAEEQRPAVSRSLETVRGRTFRSSLSRALAEMGE